uniref:Uncharacterized protein n=1 Tax=Anopheles minimus TaxID=112268 RepID=A0A182WND6_9DIPT
MCRKMRISNRDNSMPVESVILLQIS